VWVRAGTLALHEDTLTLELPQRFVHQRKGPEVLLVFAGTVQFAQNIARENPLAFAESIAEFYAECKDRAERAGLRAMGLQLDIDCPTSQLSGYSLLLTSLRTRIPSNSVLSITALPTWFTSKAFPQLVQSTDFYVPQFYESSMGSGIHDIPPIGSPVLMERCIRIAEQLGHPYWIGLPSYGHAVAYGADRVRSLVSGIGPRKALSYPNWELETISNIQGEKQVVFSLPKSNRNVRHVVFKLPTAESLRNYIEVAERLRGPSCQGIALFRMPEAGEETSLPLETLAGTILERPIASKLDISVLTESTPWRAIEVPDSSGLQKDIWVHIANIGNCSTALTKEGIRLRVMTNGQSLQFIPGDFELFSESNRKASILSERDGSTVFRTWRMLPGERLKVGPIRLLSEELRPLELEVVWTCEGDNRIHKTKNIVNP